MPTDPETPYEKGARRKAWKKAVVTGALVALSSRHRASRAGRGPEGRHRDGSKTAPAAQTIRPLAQESDRLRRGRPLSHGRPRFRWPRRRGAFKSRSWTAGAERRVSPGWACSGHPLQPARLYPAVRPPLRHRALTGKRREQAKPLGSPGPVLYLTRARSDMHPWRCIAGGLSRCGEGKVLPLNASWRSCKRCR